VSFDPKGRVSVYALPLDDFSQETIGEVVDVRMSGDQDKDLKKVLSLAKKVLAEAKQGELLEHLKLESRL